MRNLFILPINYMPFDGSPLPLRMESDFLRVNSAHLSMANLGLSPRLDCSVYSGTMDFAYTVLVHLILLSCSLCMSLISPIRLFLDLCELGIIFPALFSVALIAFWF